jgi:hypothetical protein
VRFLPPLPDANHPRHGLRYVQPPRTEPRLFLPKNSSHAIGDPGHSLLIVEGEKKALKLAQEGIASIGLGGLWNWVQKGRPISDLDRIVWKNRAVTLAPDANVWRVGDPSRLQPVYALAKELEGRGCVITILQLPIETAGHTSEEVVEWQLDDL